MPQLFSQLRLCSRTSHGLVSLFVALAREKLNLCSYLQIDSVSQKRGSKSLFRVVVAGEFPVWKALGTSAFPELDVSPAAGRQQPCGLLICWSLPPENHVVHESTGRTADPCLGLQLDNLRSISGPLKITTPGHPPTGPDYHKGR